MGIDRHFADFLLCARDGGADFRRSATLGRLNLFIDHHSLGAVFREHEIDVTDRDIGAMRSASGGYSEEFLRRLGARDIASIDASEYEGATLVHDMNQPIGAEFQRKFSVVIDGGTLEHVFNFPTAIRNCMEMLEVGGHFFTQTMANNFMGHGFYQFSPELFYRVFSPENGFRVHRAVLFESRIGKPTWYEARDPQDIGERVELINGRQTYLMLHAERIADVPIFATPPQQADYSALWSKNQPARFATRGLRGRIHQWRSRTTTFSCDIRRASCTTWRWRRWFAGCHDAAFACGFMCRCEPCGGDARQRASSALAFLRIIASRRQGSRAERRRSGGPFRARRRE